MDAAAAKAFPIRDEFIKVVFQQRGVPLPGSEALAEVGTAVNRDVGALLDVRAGSLARGVHRPGAGLTWPHVAQKAVMLMRMARRKKLTVEDVNEALRVSGRPVRRSLRRWPSARGPRRLNHHQLTVCARRLACAALPSARPCSGTRHTASCPSSPSATARCCPRRSSPK